MSETIKKIVFRKNGDHQNYLYRGDGFFLSYNPIAGFGSTSEMFANMATLFGAEDMDGIKQETALKAEDGEWLILNGDFRKAYRDAYDGTVESLMKVYRDNISSRSNWSTD